MAAKYGTPYFSNYVNSEMDPSDIRSMCPLTADTRIIFKNNKDDKRYEIDTIENIYNTKKEVFVYSNGNLYRGKPNRQKATSVLNIYYSLETPVTSFGLLGYNKAVQMGINHLQPVVIEGTNEYKLKSAKDLVVGDKIPVNNYNLVTERYINGNQTISDSLITATIYKIEEIEYSRAYLYCFEVDNYDNLFMLANGVITHNCRLRLDLRDLRKRNGGFFGSGDNTGSVGVVTINLPRIGYLSTSKEDFFERLDHMMDIAARSLKAKREVVSKLLDEGLYPYTKRYLGSFENHFSTIGIVGMHEAGLNAKWLGKGMDCKETQDFAVEMLNHMRKRLSEYQVKYAPDLYNLEATPAESTSYRLAKHDKDKYPDIIASGNGDNIFYTNSTHLPVNYTDDIYKALDVQDRLQPLYTSGTVFHGFLGQRISDWKIAANLVKTMCNNYTSPYFTLSPTYSVCPKHGYIVGEHYTCPHCGEVTEVYSRITGYYRAIQNWNIGKTSEFDTRETYDVEAKGELVQEEQCETCEIDNAKSASDGSEFDTMMNPPADFEVKPNALLTNITTSVMDNNTPVIISQERCPKCKMLEAITDSSKVGTITVDMINASEDTISALEVLEIRHTPTIIYNVDGDLTVRAYNGTKEDNELLKTLNILK